MKPFFSMLKALIAGCSRSIKTPKLNFAEITQRNGEPLKPSFLRDGTTKFSVLCDSGEQTNSSSARITRLVLSLVVFSMLHSREQQLHLNFGKIGNGNHALVITETTSLLIFWEAGGERKVEDL